MAELHFIKYQIEPKVCLPLVRYIFVELMCFTDDVMPFKTNYCMTRAIHNVHKKTYKFHNRVSEHRQLNVIFYISLQTLFALLPPSYECSSFSLHTRSHHFLPQSILSSAG